MDAGKTPVGAERVHVFPCSLGAGALGRPVVSTAVGCEGLPAGDGEHLRRFETVDEGVAALRAVLDGQAETLRANGRALVEQRFSHAAAIARLRELFSETLVGRPVG